MATSVIPKSSENTLESLIKKVSYTASYTVEANASLALTAQDFGITPISGYEPIGFATLTTGGNHVMIRGMYARTSGNVLVVRNITSSTQKPTASVELVFMKASLIE